MSDRVIPVSRKSKYGNFYTGNLLVDGKYVPGLTATGKNKQECNERLILAWSRRLAQDAHVESLKQGQSDNEPQLIIANTEEPTQENDIIEIAEKNTEI